MGSMQCRQSAGKSGLPRPPGTLKPSSEGCNGKSEGDAAGKLGDCVVSKTKRQHGAHGNAICHNLNVLSMVRGALAVVREHAC